MRSPFVEFVVIEDVAHLDGGACGVGEDSGPECIVRDVVGDGAHDVGTSESDVVGYSGFFLG